MNSRNTYRLFLPFVSKILLLGIWVLPVSANTPDLVREARLAGEFVDAIMDGEALELSDGKNQFVAIYTEAEDAKGTALILHGRGFHPDWGTVIQPLRVGLTEHGWNTLAIQLPVLNKTAKYNDYIPLFGDAIPRIEAAIAYVKAQTDNPLVVVAHSCGSHMAQHWILKQGEAAIAQFDAYVGIGMGATDYKQPMVEPFALDKMPMPVLDLYGENDYPAVIRKAEEREQMLRKAGNAKSKQIMLAGAWHYYEEHADQLVEVVADWLNGL